MAVATEISGPQVVENAPPPAPPKKTPPNQGGRPRKDGLPPGTEIGAPVASEGDFFLGLTQYEQKEWDYLILYLFRCKPITDRQSKGEPKYITKYGEPVDIDRVMRDHGSGYYQFKLVQVGAGAKGSKEVSRCYFDIMNTDYPPKVPPGDWVEDARNRDWEWCRAKLGPQAAATVQQGTSPTELVDTWIKLKAATDRPEPRNSSAELLEVLLTSPVIAALIPKPPPPPAPVEPREDPTMKMMLTMLMDDRKAMRDKMDKLEERLLAPVAPQKDLLDSLIENREKFDTLKGLFGKGASGTAAPEGWAGIADKAIDKLAGPVGQIGLIAAQRYMLQSPPAAQPAPARAPVTIQAAPQPITAPAEPQQQPQAPAVPDEQQALIAKYQGIIGQAFPFLVNHFKIFMHDGTHDGYDFRNWFLMPVNFGNVVWDQMRKEIGVDGFIALLNTMPPEIQKQFSPPDKFKQFMTEFFSDDDPPEGDDDDGEFDTPPTAVD